MTESVSNNAPPATPSAQPLVIKPSDGKEVTSLKDKGNQAIANTAIDAMGNQMKPAVEGPKAMQVPQ